LLAAGEKPEYVPAMAVMVGPPEAV